MSNRGPYSNRTALPGILAALVASCNVVTPNDGHPCGQPPYACPPGQQCVSGENVCRLPCGTGQGCPSNETCDTDGYCRGAIQGNVRILAAGQSPGGIAVDSTNVYWTNTVTNSVMSTPKDGSDPSPTTLASGQPAPSASAATNEIAVSGGYLYWLTSSSVMRRQICGACTASPTPLAPAQYDGESGAALVVGTSSVYWTFGFKILSVPVAGGSATTVVPGGGGFIDSLALSPDGATLYWTDGGGGLVAGESLAGGSPVVLSSNQQNADSVIVSAAKGVPILSFTVLIDPQHNGVQALPLQGPLMGAGNEYGLWAGTGGGGSHIAADSTAVYWMAGDSGGDLLRVALDGSGVTTLASGLSDHKAGYTAVDASGVYVADDDAILRITQ